jgi:hypothetical protein
MSNGGPVGFVTFPSLIFVFLLNEDASYDEPIPFRSDSATRLMSSCAETHRVWGVPGTEPHANLWALCQPLGIVKLDVNIRSLASDRFVVHQMTFQ